MTRTYAILKVSAVAYDEIAELLKDFYPEAFHESGEYGIVIDMHGIALAKETLEVRQPGGEQ